MGGGFAELAESRRSWLGYTGEPVTARAIEDLVSIAGSAPSETNLQPWRFIAALGADSCERLVPAFLPPNRPKLRDAGNVVLVYADPTTIDTNQTAAAFYAMGLFTPRDFAVRNASLAAMIFMLAGHAHGLPTRPMVGFDPERLGPLVDAPSHWVAVMAILIGHPRVASVEPPPRLPVDELVRFL
jgi:putative NAD(P)H nitroreductase